MHKKIVKNIKTKKKEGNVHRDRHVWNMPVKTMHFEKCQEKGDFSGMGQLMSSRTSSRVFWSPTITSTSDF